MRWQGTEKKYRFKFLIKFHRFLKIMLTKIVSALVQKEQLSLVKSM